MHGHSDMNEVTSNLNEIMAKYTDDSYWKRLKKMFVGLRHPSNSKEYKEAMVEMQRLSAPISAVLLPMVAVGLLILMSTGSSGNEFIIDTQLIEAEEFKELDQIDDFEPPPDEFQDMDIDIPIDSPNVQVDEVAPNTPMSPQPQTFDAVMTVKSPVIVKNIFGSTRNTGTRGASLARFGGDVQTEAAVMRALRWLKKNQNSDGSWQKQKIAMTGLGILTFLAHGEKPGESEEFGETVQKALEFLIKQQRDDGRFRGVDGNEYGHQIAAYALCEAYGMTLNPNVKVTAERSMTPIIKGQHPTGGWTYKMDPNPDKESGKYRDDTSYMGWSAQALKAAHLAKLRIDGLEKSMKLAVKGFQRNSHPEGGFGYTSPGRGGLTSVGVLAMQLLGASNEREVRRGLERMDSWKPSFDDKADGLGASLQYYYYYATQCKFHAGGRRWSSWNAAMKPLYISSQKIEKDAYTDHKGKKHDIGWWENKDNHGDRPVMDTCLAALQLMVYYRYLPTTSADAVKVVEEVAVTTTDTDDIRVDVGNL